ncbi:hypothetical protein LCGC14_1321760 [marine sediment metagenome]|uniref:Uncharacterized protein n=1 Tax=marine sediment metagenome TaxID=412755 RepID=A0A0F9KJT7_9ZZZZ
MSPVDEALEQPGGVVTATPPATVGLDSQAAPPPEETPAPAVATPPEPETPVEDAAPSEADDAVPTEEEKPVAPAWASYTTTDEVLGHEDFAVSLKEREATGYERGKAENQRVQGQLHKNQNQVQALDGKVAAFNTSWLGIMETAKAGQAGIDMEQVLKLRTENKEMFESLSNYRQEVGRWEGIDAFVSSIATAVESEELGQEFTERANQVKTGAIEDDTTFYTDIMAAATKAKMKPLENELVELKAKVGRLEEEKKTLTRQSGEPPPGTPSGAGAGKGLYGNLAEARTAHANGKIDNAEMRKAKLAYRS